MMQQSKIENIQVPCPICGDSNFKTLFHDQNRRDNINCSGTYVQCQKCSVIYLQSRPPWEHIVKFYSILNPKVTANAGNIDPEELRQRMSMPVPMHIKLLRKFRFRPHSWPLEKVQKESKCILDLGCGNGGKLLEFYKRGYQVWGVDVSPESVEVSKKLVPDGNFIQGQVDEVDLPESYFDYIRMDNALEHVSNPKAIINRCYKLLKKNAQVMLYVPHGRSLSMRLLKDNSITSWIPFHLQLFTKKSLEYFLNEAGFTNIKIYGYDPTPWLALSLVQWKNKGRASFVTSSPKYLDYLCKPLGSIAAKIGLAEELVAVAEN